MCYVIFPVQEPGSELIDKAVIDGAVNYTIHKQRRSGKLPIIGRVHNFGLMVCTNICC